MQQETNTRLKALWERFLDYELGHFHYVCDLFKQYERRDPAELFPGDLPEPIAFESQRDFVRQTLLREVDLRAAGTQFVASNAESAASKAYRDQLNADGSPTELIAEGYVWAPGGELMRKQPLHA